jgi:hypothetical protein
LGFIQRSCILHFQTHQCKSVLSQKLSGFSKSKHGENSPSDNNHTQFSL